MFITYLQIKLILSNWLNKIRYQPFNIRQVLVTTIVIARNTMKKKIFVNHTIQIILKYFGLGI
jgi:hypothetical protein